MLTETLMHVAQPLVEAKLSLSFEKVEEQKKVAISVIFVSLGCRCKMQQC